MNLRRGGAGRVLLGGEPRVNLLPPEVTARASDLRTRRRLGLVVVGALIVVGSAYGVASMRAVQAETELATAQQQTGQLLAEQLTYSEATTTAGAAQSIMSARALGTSTEVLWNDLLDEIAASLPPGASLASGTLTARAPWEPERAPVGVLGLASEASLVLVIRSAALFDATESVRRMSDLPGFAGAEPYQVAGVDGVFETTVTLNLDSGAWSGRFAEPADPPVGGAETTDGARAIEGAQPVDEQGTNR